jgi:hypothetical protein
MSDKVIVLCVVLAVVVIIAIVLTCRAMKYKNALRTAVSKKEVMPTAETQPEYASERQSANNEYVSRFIFSERSSSKGDRTVNISGENHARIKWIMDEANWHGMSFARYINGVLRVHFKENIEVIERLFGEMPEELKKGIK